jgi:8-oxo-dGTP pyrophosphatase MutT (NUDIX family)
MNMKEYMRELRKLVGSRPVLQCGASVIITNPEGQVLMLHRTDNDYWCFPGGAMELGERAEAAAAREVYEETGLIVDELRLFGVFSGEELYYKYPNGDEVYNVDIVFTTDKYQGEFNLNVEEGKAVRFFGIDELPSSISPPVKPVVEEFLRTRNRA